MQDWIRSHVLPRLGNAVLSPLTDGANLGVDATRIEYIVLGTLRVNGPVTFTSQSATPAGGDWVGIRFLAGSGGWLNGAVVEYGEGGVSIADASPAPRGNTVRYMHGDDGNDGAIGTPGNPGGIGTGGGPAYGIHITGVASPVVELNTVYSITGGIGGDGGNGGGGWPGYPAGSDGAAGAAGGAAGALGTIG